MSIGDSIAVNARPTLLRVSKTERDLSSDHGADALDELFTDEEFDSAFDDAIEHADLDLDIADLEALDGADADRDESDDLDAELDDDLPDHVMIVVADDDDQDDEDDDVAPVIESRDDDDQDGDDQDGEDARVIESREDEDDDEDQDQDAAVEAEAADEAVDLFAGTEIADADVDVDVDVDVEVDVDDEYDDEYELPEIIPATPDPEARTTIGDPELDPDQDDLDDEDVSDDILEELRRADIDGPVVPHAPQDDTTAAVRRPRRAADYDPAPVPIPARVPRVLGRKPRVRKVTRVVRHVDPWSVFKIAFIANVVLYIIVLTASVLLWNVAYATGTVDNVERFFESFGWNSFEFNGGELYHAGWIAGLFVVIGLTGVGVLAATLFNLITDLVGGVRFTVLEEEVVESRTSPMRRFVVRRAEPEVPALLHDSSGSMTREAVVDDTGANQRPIR